MTNRPEFRKTSAGPRCQKVSITGSSGSGGGAAPLRILSTAARHWERERYLAAARFVFGHCYGGVTNEGRCGVQIVWPIVILHSVSSNALSATNYF